MQDLSSPIRDQTHSSCSGSAVLTTGLLGKSLCDGFERSPHSLISLCSRGGAQSLSLCFCFPTVLFILAALAAKINKILGERKSINPFPFECGLDWAAHLQWVHIHSFPSGLGSKESTCNAGDLSSIPGLRRSPGEGNSYPLQYSHLENSMDCTVHRIARSQTRLSDFHFQWIE